MNWPFAVLLFISASLILASVSDENVDTSNRLKPLEIPKVGSSKHFLSEPYDITQADHFPKSITNVIKPFEHRRLEHAKPHVFFVDSLWGREVRKMNYLRERREFEMGKRTVLKTQESQRKLREINYLKEGRESETEKLAVLKKQESQRKFGGSMMDRLEGRGIFIDTFDQDVPELIQDTMDDIDASPESTD